MQNKITISVFVAFAVAIIALTIYKPLPKTPAQAGVQFCSLAASGRDNDAIKRIITPELKVVWEDAKKRNADIQKAKPDEKPPLGDGIPTQSQPDYAPTCGVGNIIESKNVTAVEIHHGFPDNPKANWTDRIVVKQVGDHWLIDDILYAPRYHDSLRKLLVRAFK